MALTPSQAFQATEIGFDFICDNTNPAALISGVNTLLMSSSTEPLPDVVALAATFNNDGIVTIPGEAGTGFFAVASINLGAGGTSSVSADTGGASLPVNLSLCQTDPASGVCLGAIATTVTTAIATNETPTFAVFVTGNAQVSFDPATNRVFARFKDGGGVTRGSTSVAVRTAP